MGRLEPLGRCQAAARLLMKGSVIAPGGGAYFQYMCRRGHGNIKDHIC